MADLSWLTAMAQGQWPSSFRTLRLIFGFQIVLSALYAECLCSANESKALLILKSKNQPNGLSSWKGGSDCCSGWAGVTCDATATHVVGLNLTGPLQLSNANDVPHIPKVLCDLSELQVLNISVGLADDFGSIPACLWNMTKVRYLSISATMHNEIQSYTSYYGPEGAVVVQGSLPTEICNLRHLVHLDLGGLAFEIGMIPNCLWTMTQLEHLTLSWANISTFSSVCNLRSLKHLDVFAYSSTGVSIPSCIWTMAELKYLSLISFTKPASITLDVCNMKNLTYLDLTESTLYGDIPSCIWNLTKLEHIQCQASLDYLQSMQDSYYSLSLSLSSDICNLRSLSYLAIRYSDLQGYFPACLWNMTRLEVLEILSFGSTTLHLPGAFSPQLCSFAKLRLFALPYIGINGVLPACLWNMSHLEVLDLSGLDLSTMEHPSEVFFAPSLTVLALKSTNINPFLMGAVESFPALSELYIPENSITALPQSIQNLSLLSTLDASNNMIASVPAWTSNSSNSELSYLDLSNNPLQSISGLCHLQGLSTLGLDNCGIGSLGTGAIPSCFRGLSRLSLLGLSGNNISGDLSHLISSSIPNLTQMLLLDLSNNRIAGNLSSFSVPYPDLWSLDLSRNQLTGELPRALLSSPPGRSSSYVGNPTYLNVSGNQLQGRVSKPFGKDWIMDLSRNNFEGSLPSFAASTFIDLILSWNRFTGPIPSELSMSQSLISLDLSNNRLSGEIPAYFGSIRHLEVLDLTSNDFNGSLPETLGNCIFLQHLRLKNNSLRGQIPSSIGKIGRSLVSFTISQNYIEGSVPSTLGDCVNLALLDLSQNNLSGTLPTSLQKLSTSLRVFTVAANGLSGGFPEWMVGGNFTSLQVLDLSNNSFHGNLPASYSRLSGFINGTNSKNNGTLYDDGVRISAHGQTLEITYFVTVRTSMDVSSNRFAGSIPESLGELRAMRYLTLSSNTFSGGIPRELSNLHELESLDLSNNSLSGSIPLDLAAIPRLAYFNASYNSLEGEIPTGGQFNTFNGSSFQHNSGLCGFPLSPCPSSVAQPASRTRGSERHGILRWVSLIGFLLGFGAGFGAMGMTFLASRRARRWLYCPSGKRGNIYTYRQPYGSYMPKQ